MEILTLSSHKNNGGAAKIASQLSYSLSKLTSVTYLDQQDSYQYSSRRPHFLKLRLNIRRKLGRLPSLVDNLYPSIYSSYSLFSSNLHNVINTIKPDLVHLHWVQGEFISIEDLSKVKLPIVWTLHDCWPFSASEHHQWLSSKEHFCEGYSTLPPYHPARITYSRKRKAWMNLNIFPVCPSPWIMAKSQRSSLFSSFHHTLIPNPIDLKTFSQGNKSEARQDFGIPILDKTILIGGLSSSTDPIKGYDLALEALYKLHRKMSNLTLLVLGNAMPHEVPGLKTINLGYLSDNAKLSAAFTAADLTCVPSRLETHSQMAAESISCSTPVVAFNIAGNPSIVDHMSTGYLARPYDTDDLARGMYLFLSNAQSSQSPQKYQSKRREWDCNTIARRYLDLYQHILQP